MDDLARFLADAGVVSREDVDRARALHPRATTTLFEFLVLAGAVDEERACDVLAERFKLPRARGVLAPAAPLRPQDMLPGDIAADHRVMPVRVDGDGALTVATSDPLDARAQYEIAFFTGCRVLREVASPSAIAAALHRYYGEVTPLESQPDRCEEVVEVLLGRVVELCREATFLVTRGDAMRAWRSRACGGSTHRPDAEIAMADAHILHALVDAPGFYLGEILVDVERRFLGEAFGTPVGNGDVTLLVSLAAEGQTVAVLGGRAPGVEIPRYVVSALSAYARRSFESVLERRRVECGQLDELAARRIHASPPPRPQIAQM